MSDDPRSINEAGIRIIQSFEGLTLTAKPTLENPKIYQIGYGHTGSDVKPGDTVTEPEADELFFKDLVAFEYEIDHSTPESLSDNQFSALVCFIYNIGIKKFQESTLLKYISEGRLDLVPTEMMKWINIKGKISQGLIRRRDAEVHLWNTPDQLDA